MAVAEHGRRRAGLAPLGDQHRPAADRVVDDLALEAEPGEGRRDLVGQIGAQHRRALLDLAFGRDRDAAAEIGDKPALVEIALGGGDGGVAGHGYLPQNPLPLGEGGERSEPGEGNATAEPSPTKRFALGPPSPKGRGFCATAAEWALTMRPLKEGGSRCRDCRTLSNRARPSAWPPASPSPRGRSITPTGSTISSMCARASSTGCAPAARPSCCARIPARATARPSTRRAGW